MDIQKEEVFHWGSVSLILAVVLICLDVGIQFFIPTSRQILFFTLAVPLATVTFVISIVGTIKSSKGEFKFAIAGLILSVLGVIVPFIIDIAPLISASLNHGL
jgi:hypothetical protein